MKAGRLRRGAAALVVGLWLGTFPALAFADTCAERAAAIRAGTSNSIDDPDCSKGGVIGAIVNWGVAAGTGTAVVTAILGGMGVPGLGPAVSGAGGTTVPGPGTGPGGTGGFSGGPPPGYPTSTVIISGPEARDILQNSGLLGPDGQLVPGWENKPIKPIPRRELGGASYPVDPATGKPVGPPEFQIINTVTGITGVAMGPDGNVVIVTNQTSTDWQRPPAPPGTGAPPVTPPSTVAPPAPTIVAAPPPTTVAPPPTTVAPPPPTTVAPPPPTTVAPPPPTTVAPPPTTVAPPPTTVAPPPTTVAPPPTTVAPPPTTVAPPPPTTVAPPPPTTVAPPPSTAAPPPSSPAPPASPPGPTPSVPAPTAIPGGAPPVTYGVAPPGTAVPPPIYPQQTPDSCAVATSRMAIQRLTGRDIPEARLRQFSDPSEGGWRPGVGTTSNGSLDLLNHLPGIHAEARSMTLQEMQQAIADGQQVLVPHRTPGGGHIALLNNVQVRPDGRAVLTIDDPGGWGQGANPYQHQRSNTWWEQNGWDHVIVVERTGTLPPP